METPKNEPWNFCETPEEKCTMNYCDDNGCQNRKRMLVNPVEKSTLEQQIEKLEAEKAELLEALEIFFPMFTELDSEFGIENPRPREWTETEISTVQRLFDLIQKHKQ